MKNKFMELAIIEAQKAADKKEVPVGVVIVKDDVVISCAHNLRESLKDSTAHAEILAIRAACKVLNNWRLTGCDMYVTLEPCPMCAGAIIQSRIRRVYIGSFEPNTGSCGSVVNLLDERLFGNYVDVEWVYSEECSRLLQNFFRNRR